MTSFLPREQLISNLLMLNSTNDCPNLLSSKGCWFANVFVDIINQIAVKICFLESYMINQIIDTQVSFLGHYFTFSWTTCSGGHFHALRHIYEGTHMSELGKGSFIFNQSVLEKTSVLGYILITTSSDLSHSTQLSNNQIPKMTDIFFPFNLLHSYKQLIYSIQ